MDQGAIIREPEAALTYILAGRSRVTLKSLKTGDHYTYEVVAKDEHGPHFVRVLGGEDNWLYIGTIFERRGFKWTRKAVCSNTAPAYVAFSWVFGFLAVGHMPATVEVWHSGRCGRCGRELTDPESIARGLGPVCAQKGAATD